LYVETWTENYFGGDGRTEKISEDVFSKKGTAEVAKQAVSRFRKCLCKVVSILKFGANPKYGYTAAK
jgi:hypothetical protein